MRQIAARLIVAMVVLAGCSSGGGAAPDPTVDPNTEWEKECPGEAVRVLYDSSASKASVTAMFPDGMAQGEFVDRLRNKKGGVGLHFCTNRGTPLSISAQNQNSTGGVTCRIEVDGVNVSYNNSEGAYVIASCTALA